MSFSKNDRLFPLENGPLSGDVIAQAIALALRREYREIHSAVKVIGRQTGAHPRAIRNWYDGLNAPNCRHFINLARHTPVIIETFLGLTGHAHLWELHRQRTGSQDNIMAFKKTGQRPGVYSDKSVTIKVTLDVKKASKLNQRQLWFLGRLQRGENPRAEDIAETWDVTLRTARRDVAAMCKLGLIRFVGARKTGFYRLRL